jgi:hypothetical protein
MLTSNLEWVGGFGALAEGLGKGSGYKGVLQQVR